MRSLGATMISTVALVHRCWGGRSVPFVGGTIPRWRIVVTMINHDNVACTRLINVTIANPSAQRSRRSSDHSPILNSSLELSVEFTSFSAHNAHLFGVRTTPTPEAALPPSELGIDPRRCIAFPDQAHKLLPCLDDANKSSGEVAFPS